MPYPYFDPKVFDPTKFDTKLLVTVVPDPDDSPSSNGPGVPLNQYKDRKTLYEMRTGHKRRTSYGGL